MPNPLSIPPFSSKSVTATAPALDIVVGSSSAYLYSSTLIHAFTIGALAYTDLPLWLLLPALCFTLAIYSLTCSGLTTGTPRSNNQQGELRWQSGNRLSWQPCTQGPVTPSNEPTDSPERPPAQTISGPPANFCYQCPTFIVVGIAAQSPLGILIPRDAVAPAAYRALRARIALYQPDESLS